MICCGRRSVQKLFQAGAPRLEPRKNHSEPPPPKHQRVVARLVDFWPWLQVRLEPCSRMFRSILVLASFSLCSCHCCSSTSFLCLDSSLQFHQLDFPLIAFGITRIGVLTTAIATRGFTFTVNTEAGQCITRFTV